MKQEIFGTETKWLEEVASVEQEHNKVYVPDWYMDVKDWIEFISQAEDSMNNSQISDTAKYNINAAFRNALWTVYRAGLITGLKSEQTYEEWAAEDEG